MNINGKTTNPGALNTSITLQKRTVTVDAAGFGVESWTTLAVVWSEWINAHGDEGMVGGSVAADQTALVKIRYRSDVNDTCVVLKGSARFEIIRIDNIRERNEWLELKVRRMAAG